MYHTPLSSNRDSIQFLTRKVFWDHQETWGHQESFGETTEILTEDDIGICKNRSAGDEQQLLNSACLTSFRDPRMNIQFLIHPCCPVPSNTHSSSARHNQSGYRDEFKLLVQRVVEAEGITVVTQCSSSSTTSSSSRAAEEEEEAQLLIGTKERKITVFLPARVRRFRFSPAQKRVLESIYRVYPDATPKDREYLAHRLGITPRQAHTWFHNKRTKRKQRPSKSAPSTS